MTYRSATPAEGAPPPSAGPLAATLTQLIGADYAGLGRALAAATTATARTAGALSRHHAACETCRRGGRLGMDRGQLRRHQCRVEAALFRRLAAELAEQLEHAQAAAEGDRGI